MSRGTTVPFPPTKKKFFTVDWDTQCTQFPKPKPVCTPESPNGHISSAFMASTCPCHGHPMSICTHTPGPEWRTGPLLDVAEYRERKRDDWSHGIDGVDCPPPPPPPPRAPYPPQCARMVAAAPFWGGRHHPGRNHICPTFQGPAFSFGMSDRPVDSHPPRSQSVPIDGTAASAEEEKSTGKRKKGHDRPRFISREHAKLEPGVPVPSWAMCLCEDGILTAREASIVCNSPPISRIGADRASSESPITKKKATEMPKSKPANDRQKDGQSSTSFTFCTRSGAQSHAPSALSSSGRLCKLPPPLQRLCTNGRICSPPIASASALRRRQGLPWTRPLHTQSCGQQGGERLHVWAPGLFHQPLHLPRFRSAMIFLRIPAFCML